MFAPGLSSITKREKTRDTKKLPIGKKIIKGKYFKKVLYLCDRVKKSG